MGEPKHDASDRLPAESGVTCEGPWAVLDRARAAFADVPVEIHEAEVARIIAESRAEARAEAARK